MAQFTFDRAVQRYRNSKGQFISNSKMLELTQRAIDLAKTDANTIADLFVDGKIALAEWQRGTALALKQAHIQSYLLGRGGQKMMTQRDYGIIGQKLQREYAYLDQFADAIKEGMSEAQFRARLQQYLNNPRTTYEAARREGHQEAGYSWERRVLGTTNNCNPCVNYAERGWVMIGELPAIGAQCDCRANCRCSFEFEREQPTNSWALSAGFGWLGKSRFSDLLHG